MICYECLWYNAPFILQVVVPRLEFFLGSGTAPPRSPHFVRVVHTIGGRPLIGHSVLTVNNSRMTVLQTMVTEKQPPLTLTQLQGNVQYLNSPYVVVLHQKITDSQPYVHCGPHLQLPL